MRIEKGSLLKKPLQFWVRLALGVIFLIAVADKICHPGAFAQAIYHYQILPGALTLADALLLTFYGALIFNLARGLDVHCGCFSASTGGKPAALWRLIRDGAFLLMAGYLFFKIVASRRLSDAPGHDS